jgi:DNA-binding transcriptional LysR family regulator
MHISRVDLNLLVVLESIYTEGGITKAADRLHLTQPAISHALSRLRDLMGDPLFERQGHKMVPTALVRRMIGPLRESLGDIGSLLNDAQAFDAATSRRQYVVGLRDYVETALLAPLMRAVSAEAPNVRISTVRVDRKKVEGELASGAIDFAIDMQLPTSDQVFSTRVRSDAFAVVARAGHPAIEDGRIDIDAYLAQRHVLVSSRRTGIGFEDLELRRLGYERQVALRCQGHFAASRAVAQSDLLLTMSSKHAVLTNQQFGNQVLPFPVPLPAYDAYLYWHSSMDGDPGNRWVRQLIVRFAGG